MDGISIKTNIQKAQKALSTTSYKMPAIQKSVLRIFAKGALKAIKKQIKQDFRRHTGGLYNAYTYTVKDDFATVYPSTKTAHGKRIVPIVSALNYGTVITAKRAPFLSFMGRHFIKTKQVIIKGTDFLDAGKKDIQSTTHTKEVNTYIQKQFNRYWG